MALILCLETSTQICSVALFSGSRRISLEETRQPNAHSARLTLMIEKILKDSGFSFSDLEAVAISRGPGSYTGLRIGAGVAKGLCYALDIPLISVSTLQAMAIEAGRILGHPEGTLVVPMIDARRMEVYSAIYTPQGEEIRDIRAEIIHESSFHERKENLLLCGDGAGKCRGILNHNPRIRFLDDLLASASHMGGPALSAFQEKRFESTAYFEPFYLKDFIAGIPHVKGLK